MHTKAIPGIWTNSLRPGKRSGASRKSSKKSTLISLRGPKELIMAALISPSISAYAARPQKK